MTCTILHSVSEDYFSMFFSSIDVVIPVVIPKTEIAGLGVKLHSWRLPGLPMFEAWHGIARTAAHFEAASRLGARVR